MTNQPVKNRSVLTQSGQGLGSDAWNWLKGNPDKVANFAWENRSKIFQGVSNAQRFYEKNVKGNKKPIRYLFPSEFHVAPGHNFTGPGTRMDLPEVRNHKPYNEIDACSKVHDIEFDRIFKMPQGKARKEAIRKADREALECYNKHKNVQGYKLAHGGINSKITLEDINPDLFDKIMGEAYRGVKPAIEQAEKKESSDAAPESSLVLREQRGGGMRRGPNFSTSDRILSFADSYYGNY